MQRPEWAVPEVDLEQPSASRMYDYLLGGSHNVRADRELADQMLKLAPEACAAAQANRAFLRRAVTTLADAGIRQFLDIGSGIPTRGNVHEVAQRHAADCRVAYVDIDPIAVAHSNQMLAGNPGCVAIQGDLRQPGQILDNPRVRALLDFDEPIGLLLVAVLHFVPDSDDPHGAVARLRDALVPGSHLAISHAGWPTTKTDDVIRARDTYDKTPTSLILRDPTEVAEFFSGWQIMDPGVVTVTHWRPEANGSSEDGARADQLPGYAAVAVKS
jgi:SAM-dependent methyltransferase